MSDTGDARVDAAISLLVDLDGAPIHEHPAVFEAVHARLREVLADADLR